MIKKGKKRKPMLASDVIKTWRKDPAFVRAYDALEGEFAVLKAVSEARRKSRLSQMEIAKHMKTSQTAVARLESGRGNPSIKTLQRYATATGTRLKITFEQVKR
jgi:ribosome-binding protein aMBF1 (putative translation factor)